MNTSPTGALRPPSAGTAASDRLLRVLVTMAGAAAAVVMLLIALFLLRASLPVIGEAGPLAFVLDAEWAPRDGQYNLLPMLVSSLLLTAGALLVATPLALGFAVYCTFYGGGRTVHVLLRLVDISAGMPTVIYGFWGLVVLVPLIGSFAPPGTSILAGILVLALMVFPTIAVVSHAAIAAVPRTYLHASAALGIRRSSILRHVVFHHARAGILAATMLGAARAMGETIVVLMVCGNVVQVPSSLADPVRTLTANIALEMPYALGNHQSALYATGLAVLLVVTALVLASEAFARRQQGAAP